MSVGIRYNKPLSFADRVLIDTVTTRYEGVGAAFVAFDRGDHIELKCPERIAMTAERLAHLKEAQVANSFATPTTPTLRLSENGGQHRAGN